MDINLDQKNAKLWVQTEEIKISINLLEDFFNKFVKNETNLLYQELIDQWNFFVNQCSYKKLPSPNVSLPQNISNYMPNNLRVPGVYSIFGKHINSVKPLCFYVGMSASGEKFGNSSSIKTRLLLHFNKDLDPEGPYGIYGFKGCFYWLRQCSEIFICWAEAEANYSDDNLRNKLLLLESCLAVKLQALFLIGSNLQKFSFF